MVTAAETKEKTDTQKKDEAKLYEEIARRASQFKSEYESSKKNDQIYLDNYSELIKQYWNFVVPYEGYSPFMYLDTPGGVPTIGYGHLLHFKFLGENVRKLVGSLRTKIPPELTATNLDYPQQINALLPISKEENLTAYSDRDVCFGLLDAMSLPFKKSEAQMKPNKDIDIVKTADIGDRDKQLLVSIAYNEILMIAIKMKARAAKFNMEKVNLFRPRVFYSPILDNFTKPAREIEGNNSIVIMKNDAAALAKMDTAIKIKQLIKPIDNKTKTFEDFDKYPLTAKLALLELSYNAGVAALIKVTTFKNLVLSKDWEKLAKLPTYPRRSDPIYNTRNQQVRKWFEKAAEVQKDAKSK